MMMHPDLAIRQHEARRADMLRAARLDALLRQAEADRDALPHRWLLMLSDAMINGGVRLKRYASSATTRPLTGAETHLALLPKID